MWSTSNLLIRRFLLKIHRAHLNDAGIYKCNVVNGFGHVQAQFQVNIKCKERKKKGIYNKEKFLLF